MLKMISKITKYFNIYFLNNLPALIIFLAGGHLSRKIYAVVGRSTATTEAAAIACIPFSLTSSRWLIALAPTSAPNLRQLSKYNLVFKQMQYCFIIQVLLHSNTHRYINSSALKGNKEYISCI